MKSPLLLASLACGITCAACAQDFHVDWFTIDGGGGASAGGQFTVRSTIGQPDAGVMSGGTFKVAGGFWSGISLVQTAGGPVLKIQPIDGGRAIIS